MCEASLVVCNSTVPGYNILAVGAWPCTRQGQPVSQSVGRSVGAIVAVPCFFAIKATVFGYDTLCWVGQNGTVNNPHACMHACVHAGSSVVS